MEAESKERKSQCCCYQNAEAGPKLETSSTFSHNKGKSKFHSWPQLQHCVELISHKSFLSFCFNFPHISTMTAVHCSRVKCWGGVHPLVSVCADTHCRHTQGVIVNKLSMHMKPFSWWFSLNINPHLFWSSHKWAWREPPIAIIYH